MWYPLTTKSIVIMIQLRIQLHTPLHMTILQFSNGLVADITIADITAGQRNWCFAEIGPHRQILLYGNCCLWCDTWQMALNPAKCEALCISNNLSPPVFQYEFKAYPIMWVGVKYLGVTILKWNSHCYLIARKATRIFNILRQTMFGCSAIAKYQAF